MALLAGELARDPELSEATREDVKLLLQQIGVCKEIITGLSRRAGAERLESSPLQAANRWLDHLRQNWHAARPNASSRLIVASDGEAPEIIADPRLEQAVLNLLNNAANATTTPLDIRLSWCTDNLCIDIRDRGPGFPAQVLELGGTASFPAHERGSGVGLMLTRSAVEQMGGTLTLSNPEEGGALARIELPRTNTWPNRR
jgi:two-component system sensor histidine kinase RegB